MTVRIDQKDLPKLAKFILQNFETPGEFNRFLQDYVWSAYREAASPLQASSPVFRELDGSPISIRSVTRARNGTRLLQLLPLKGQWWEVEKRRGGLWHPIKRHEGKITTP